MRFVVRRVKPALHVDVSTTLDSRFTAMKGTVVMASMRFPRLAIWLAKIAAAVHDGKNEHSFFFQPIHDAITLHNNFAQRFIVGLRNAATRPSAFSSNPRRPNRVVL